MDSDYGSRNTAHRDWPAIDLPLHREALRKAALEAGMRSGGRTRRSFPSAAARKVGMALVPAVATCVAILLLVTLMGSPLTGQKALAKARKWYETQEAGGKWEHALIRIRTHADLFGRRDLHEYDYEQWQDTETGDAKVVITDPRTGEVVETLVAIRDARIDVPYPSNPLHWYRVYSSNAEGESSYLESRHQESDDSSAESATENVAIGYPVPTIGVFEPVQTLPSGEFPEGYVMPRECSPLDADATRINLLAGEGKSFVTSGRLEILGREEIGEPGTRALVVGGTELRYDPVAGVTPPPEHDIVFDTRLYFEPDTYAYRGIGTTLYRDAKAEWTDTALYEKLEFTDEAPDMSIRGMREIRARMFEGGMWPGFPPTQ